MKETVEFKNGDRLLTVKETAERLRCSPSKVYEMRYRGVLNGLKNGGAVLFWESDILESLRKNEDGAKR